MTWQASPIRARYRMLLRWLGLCALLASPGCLGPILLRTNCAKRGGATTAECPFQLPMEAVVPSAWSLFKDIRTGGALPARRPVRLFIRPMYKELGLTRGADCALIESQLATWNPAMWTPRPGVRVEVVDCEAEADWVLEGAILHLRIQKLLDFMIPRREYDTKVGFRVMERSSGRLLWWCTSWHTSSAIPGGFDPNPNALSRHLNQHLLVLSAHLHAALDGLPPT